MYWATETEVAGFCSLVSACGYVLSSSSCALDAGKTRVSRRAQELYGQLDKTASNDAAQMAVGMVLFWPALFFLEGGDGPEAAEYARLKGERDALEQVAIQKHCDPAIIPLATEPPKPEAAQAPEPRRNYNRPVGGSQARPD